MLKVALIGFGQMGRLIAKLAPAHSLNIVKIFDPAQSEHSEEINSESLRGVDVCIDFSLPDKVIDNIVAVNQAGKNLVIGTTGWYDKLPMVSEIVKESETGVVYASNFSIGMNLFFRLVDIGSELINASDIYDPFGYEMHHNKKSDSPSGTAKDLAEIIKRNFPVKERIEYDRLERRIENNELHFASIRAGSIPGTHVVGYDSPFDTIELKHTARTREGFAVGAIKAAQWISGKKGLFDFQAVFTDVLLK